ncbi:serine/threonine-protein kinase [Micromonospora sp. NPDC049559]|uniref:serine/threonine protein kinase n=1 Tax=Micromonospora sp. NPDC049559 TaxID=3155923 RepID=UPI0034144A9A
MALEQGAVFAGYVIERLIGSGDTGEVYAARHPRLPRSDALKVLGAAGDGGSGYRQRFEQAVDAVTQLRHPHIAAIHDRGEFDGRLWVATDLVDGPSLAELIRSSPAGLPPAQVGHIAVAVAGALDYAHSRGVLHRDVKPANIRVGPQGQVALTDFGLARLSPDGATPANAGVMLETVRYSSPEQLQGGHLDGRSDQYSLACTMFHLLTGHAPYENVNPVAVIAAHLGQPVPSLRRFHPYLAPAVDAVIGRAMAKDPGYRYGSCVEFANALSASLAASMPAPATSMPGPDAAMPAQPAGPAQPDGPAQPVAPAPVAPQPVPAHQPGQPGQPGPPGISRRLKWVIAGAALAACVVLVAAAVVVVTLTRPKEISAWDDRLYPQEIPSIFRAPARDELLQALSGPPSPIWTTPIRGGRAEVVGGGSRIVLLQLGTYLVGLDMNTGAPRWPNVDLHDTATSCAVRENRIGCVSPAGNGSDSTVFILDTGSGQIVKTLKVPNRELRSMLVSGDRFIAMAEDLDKDKGFAVGYTTEGEQVWTREGHDGMYVSASQQILVDGAYDADEVVFLSTADGREVLRSKRATKKRDMTWNVFRGGIAIQNQDWTGTDIYDLDGKKTSSVAGWEPAGYQNRYAPISPLPLLTRLGARAPHYPDRHTVAAANPKTGHLLWRISGTDLSTNMATVDDKLVMKVAEPGTSGDPAGEPEPTNRDFVRVYDCFTGELLSPTIDMTRKSSVEPYWIESDGIKLVYTYAEDGKESPYVTVGYDLRSGEKSWELPLRSRTVYPGGGIVAATGPEAVSLFR